MTDALTASRRTFLAGAAALAAAPGAALAAGPPPEHPNLKIGLALSAATFLPLYLSGARTAKDEGLNVQIIPFRGDAEVAQALVGDSIDISAQSLTGLLNMVTANQGVIGFYSGFYQANFSWLAIPSIKSWADLKGKQIGISTFGSETDALTRYALKRHGLVPEKDVQMVQAGGSPSAIQALRAGRLTASILTAPFKWQAQEEGMTLLGTQAQEVSPQWPIHMIMAKLSFINANPNTITAVLRAHVNAIRLARSNKDFATSVLMDQLKLTKQNADRSWDEIVPGYNERGTLPDKGMPVFWQIAESEGAVKAPLPVDKFLDQKWIKSFNQWAPK